MIISVSNQIGIILPGERSDLVMRASSELSRQGYLSEPSDVANAEVISALNDWRADNSLPALGYFDPVSLRKLGFDVGGDEIILLARRAEVLPTEIERCDFCLKTLKSAKLTGATPIASLPPIKTELPQASLESLRCALIAFLIAS